jgi:hypothetical protein
LKLRDLKRKLLRVVLEPWDQFHLVDRKDISIGLDHFYNYSFAPKDLFSLQFLNQVAMWHPHSEYFKKYRKLLIILKLDFIFPGNKNFLPVEGGGSVVVTFLIPVEQLLFVFYYSYLTSAASDLNPEYFIIVHCIFDWDL